MMGMGDRVRETAYTPGNPPPTTYLNDAVGLTQVFIAFTEDDGSIKTVNRLGLDLVAQDKQGATRLYLATDGLGSVRVETQGASAVAAKLYNPFGAVLEQYGTSQTTYGYTGEQFNATSRLSYLRARYYNPNLRVFSAKDPFAGSLTAPASMHGYSYAHNNPILYTDPTGKYIESPLDLAFILFDIGSLGYNLYHGYTAQTHADRVYYSNQASIDVVALAIDFGMLGTPGATGGGMAYRGVQLAAAGGKTINIVVDCSKLARVAREAQLGLKGAQLFPHILLAQSGSGSGGGGGSSSSSGGSSNPYSGDLVKSPKFDPDAELLANQLGGEASVYFKNDPIEREFDVVSDSYIGQTTDRTQIGSSFRKQARATFEAALATGRKVYYQFQTQPSSDLINALNRYSQEYGVDVVIETP